MNLNLQIQPSSVFLVTGGARGITAACTIALAQHFPCKWILVGRSKLDEVEADWAKNCWDENKLKKRIVHQLREEGLKPAPKDIEKVYKSITANREIRQTLATIIRLGREVEYLSVDVTDGSGLQQRLTPIVERMGEITGIIHGAGNIADKLIEKKTLEDFENVYAPKVKGLANLLHSIPLSQLDYLILFASVSGFYGNSGQTDYAIANEILNKSAHLVKQLHPQCHVLAINWGIIEGGMVTPQLKKFYALHNMEIVPIESATAILINEVAAVNNQTPQIVIGNAIPSPVVELNSPLCQHRIHRHLTLEANPFLHDHKIGGYPVLPFTCAMSWVANTCEQLYPGYKLFSLTNCQMLKGISFDETLPSEYILDIKEIAKSQANGIEVAAQIWSTNPEGKIRYHFRAKAHLLPQLPDAPIYDSMNLTSDGVITGSKEDFYKEDNISLFHGTMFQGVERILNISSQKITAQCLVRNITKQEQGQFPIGSINPYMVDIGLHSAWILLQHFDNCGALPSQIDKFEVFTNFGFDKPFYVSTEIISKNNHEAVINLIFHDYQGKIYFRGTGSKSTIVPLPMKWRNRSSIKTLGLNSTNPNANVQQTRKTVDDKNQEDRSFQSVKMAVVGMDALFGSCDGLDAFERTIYEGTQDFIPVPPQRWQGAEEQPQLLQKFGFPEGKAPLGSYIKEIAMPKASGAIAPVRFKIPPDEVGQISLQELIILKVSDRALQDAGVKVGDKVAVIIAMGTELSVHQLRDGKIDHSLSSESIAQLETLLKDSLQPPTTGNPTGDDIASWISSLWNFHSPALTINPGENSTFKALTLAQELLADGEVDAVLVGAVDLAGGIENVLLRHQIAPINTGTATLSYDQKANGWLVGEGGAAIVLKRLEKAKENSDRIYATIDAISLVQGASQSKDIPSLPPESETITQACQEAFQLAGYQPSDIGYLEVFGSGIKLEDESEIHGLLQAYRTSNPDLSCAIGSIKANIGHTYTASGMAGLIKTVLCLYHRYLPAVPQWIAPKMPEIWQGSPFYVPTESKPWFVSTKVGKRVAAISGIGIDGTYAHLMVSEEPLEQKRPSKYLEQTPFYLFAIAADTPAALLAQLHSLDKTIQNTSSLSTAAIQTFTAFEANSQATYSLAILGHTKTELIQEIQRALKGVVDAFENGTDWQTPVGSYFTPKPLGKTGKIAFVYPGLFTTYLGLSRDIFRVFPKIWDDFAVQSCQSTTEHLDRVIHPRSLNKLSSRQLEKLEQQLIEDPPAMSEYGVGISRLMTAIMRDYFRIKPDIAFGYSLGEIAMICSQDIWENFLTAIQSLNSSPLFSNRLAGAKNAVLEYWGLPLETSQDLKSIWTSHILIAPASQVWERVKSENRVYLTHINTPNEVAIAGDSQGCLNVIKSLQCNGFRLPFDQVLHCEVMASEYKELVRICTVPIQEIPETVFYSTANYEPIAINSHAIGESIAKGLCQPLDFPRLINRVYADGARIFVEAGGGSTCSRWIKETLKEREHIAIPLNQRGVTNHKSIVKALAKLVSHRVAVDLSPLYSSEKNTVQKDLYNLDPIPVKEPPISESLSPISLQESPISESLSPISLQESPISVKEPPISQNLPHSDSPQISQNYEQIEEIILSALQDPQYQLNSEYNTHLTKVHTAFLQARQEGLQQLGKIIQLQIAIAQSAREAVDPLQPPFLRGENLPQSPLERGENFDPPQPPFLRGENLPQSPLETRENLLQPP